MPYRIEVSPQAQQELRGLTGFIRAQAIELIEALAETPRPARAKELHGKPQIYRIWLARTWRIAYEIDDDQLVVLILRVQRKDEIDYESL